MSVRILSRPGWWRALLVLALPALSLMAQGTPGGAPLAAGKAKFFGGSGATGWDWLIKCFQLARQYSPGKKLVLNEYSVTNSEAAARRYLAIIDLLKARDLVDVIGVQGHAFETRVAAAVTAANLEQRQLARDGRRHHLVGGRICARCGQRGRGHRGHGDAGAYTAKVTGADGGTGAAMVEIYAIP